MTLDGQVSIDCKIKDVQKDIDKLGGFLQKRSNAKNFFGHILVWSVALSKEYDLGFKTPPAIRNHLTMMPDTFLGKLKGIRKSSAEVRL